MRKAKKIEGHTYPTCGKSESQRMCVFGMAKLRFRHGRDPNARELPFSVLDFL